MEKVHIKARVVRMRKVPAFLNPSESISLEMVLIDVKGGKIHVSVRILINPDIPEVESFKDSIGVHGIENESKVPLIGECAKPSLEEEFLCYSNRRWTGLMVSRLQLPQNVIPDGGSYFCSACDMHVFHIVMPIITHRFRVKLKVTDGKSTDVFVLFDSDMSYIMKKLCSFFVAQSKAKNFGPYPIEFDSLVRYKMLFVVDIALKLTAVTNGSYRINREISGAIDLESDVDSYGSDDIAVVETMGFVKDLIVTPPMTRGKDEI
ncbi:replication protein A 70 kDa DNA-binding subunit E [Trifolium repens]|nr:replication protein A 70 kDa DNA-binding subunit E [Trifolium repens]